MTDKPYVHECPHPVTGESTHNFIPPVAQRGQDDKWTAARLKAVRLINLLGDIVNEATANPMALTAFNSPLLQRAALEVYEHNQEESAGFISKVDDGEYIRNRLDGIQGSAASVDVFIKDENPEIFPTVTNNDPDGEGFLDFPTFAEFVRVGIPSSVANDIISRHNAKYEIYSKPWCDVTLGELDRMGVPMAPIQDIIDKSGK